RGFEPLLIDAGAVANSIYHYPTGMVFFTTPERLEIGGHPLTCAGPKPTREEALKYYRGVARAEGLRLRTCTRLASAARGEGRLQCQLDTRQGSETASCDRLVLATGYFDHPNRLGVPGEDLPHVSHYLDEPHGAFGQDVVVIGGKNSAVEAALQLFRAGARVTLVYRKAELPKSVKYWLKPDLENRIQAGEIRARFGAQVLEVTSRDVRVCLSTGAEERLPADRVYPLIGFHPDFDLFRRIGISFEETTGRPSLDPDSLETNVPGVFLAGSVTAGREISEIFIENGRFDGERIFGDPETRSRIMEEYRRVKRPVGE
ncbi:MAG: YpdA family putative bacillithiol disulfide reductase, partial [Gemmatimonadales bacterium]